MLCASSKNNYSEGAENSLECHGVRETVEKKILKKKSTKQQTPCLLGNI